MEAVSSIGVREAPGALQEVPKVSVNFGACSPVMLMSLG